MEAEAIKILERLLSVNILVGNESEAVSLAIKALEKQIAKKPFVDTGNFLKCSHCHSVVKNTYKYCHECGQKLDSEV